MRVLNFEETGVQELSLAELKVTSKERFNDSYQNKIWHANLFENIAEKIDRSNLDFKMGPIYAAQNKAKFMQGASTDETKWPNFGDNALETWTLRRLVTNFEIETLSDARSNTSLAISYHQNGIQIAMGPNIRVCSNMSILGAGNYIRSYGNDKVTDPNQMLEIIGEWMTEFEDRRTIDNAILNEMTGRKVNELEVAEIIGRMSIERVRRDKLKSNRVPPLTQAQISQFTLDYLTAYEKGPEYVETLYDIYNLITNMHKVGLTDVPNIMDQNISAGTFLISMYGLGKN